MLRSQDWPCLVALVSDLCLASHVKASHVNRGYRFTYLVSVLVSLTSHQNKVAKHSAKLQPFMLRFSKYGADVKPRHCTDKQRKVLLCLIAVIPLYSWLIGTVRNSACVTVLPSMCKTSLYYKQSSWNFHIIWQYFSCTVAFSENSGSLLYLPHTHHYDNSSSRYWWFSFTHLLLIHYTHQNVIKCQGRSKAIAICTYSVWLILNVILLIIYSCIILPVSYYKWSEYFHFKLPWRCHSVCFLLM